MDKNGYNESQEVNGYSHRHHRYNRLQVDLDLDLDGQKRDKKGMQSIIRCEKVIINHFPSRSLISSVPHFPHLFYRGPITQILGTQLF